MTYLSKRAQLYRFWREVGLFAHHAYVGITDNNNQHLNMRKLSESQMYIYICTMLPGSLKPMFFRIYFFILAVVEWSSLMSYKLAKSQSVRKYEEKEMLTIIMSCAHFDTLHRSFLCTSTFTWNLRFLVSDTPSHLIMAQLVRTPTKMVHHT